MGASKELTGRGYAPGSIAMCAVCPAANNCCSRVNAAHGVDAPIAFQHEVDAIVRATGQAPATFAIAVDSSPYSWLKSTPDGCVFLRAARCTIYKDRPLDCRIFPLDLVCLPDGRIAWIAYTSVCPTDYNTTALLQAAKGLFCSSAEYMAAYANARTPLLDQHAFEILEFVE